jgi:DNA-binding transcriptional ArsR family regulator
LMRGAIAIGVERPDAFRLAIRCARESLPPLRLLVLQDVALNPMAEAGSIWRRVGKPRRTIQRHLEALKELKLLVLTEEPQFEMTEDGNMKQGKSKWYYDVDPSVDLSPLHLMGEQPMFVEVGDPRGVPTWE